MKTHTLNLNAKAFKYIEICGVAQISLQLFISTCRPSYSHYYLSIRIAVQFQIYRIRTNSWLRSVYAIRIYVFIRSFGRIANIDVNIEFLR